MFPCLARAVVPLTAMEIDDDGSLPAGALPPDDGPLPSALEALEALKAETEAAIARSEARVAAAQKPQRLTPHLIAQRCLDASEVAAFDADGLATRSASQPRPARVPEKPLCLLDPASGRISKRAQSDGADAAAPRPPAPQLDGVCAPAGINPSLRASVALTRPRIRLAVGSMSVTARRTCCYSTIN